MKLLKISLLVLFTFISLPHSANAQTPTYRLLKKVTIGGEGGWDYLNADPQHRRLYIAHGMQVEVYDLDHDSIIGHIPNTEGVHGIAISKREGHGFISNGRSNTVLMFDLVTLDTIRRIAVGEKPDAIVYDPASKHVFVMDGKSEDITVLDAGSGDVVTTIKLQGAPEFAVSDERGHVYVNLEDKSEVVRIDSRSNTIEHVWPLAPGERPTGIAMDRGISRLFIGCANQKMIVMDAANGKILQSLPIGKGVDAVVFDPFTRLAFSSNGEGNVTIMRELDQNSFEVTQTLATERGARTIALDTHTQDIYLVTAQFGPAPAATSENPHPRPSILPNTFMVLKYGPGKP